MKAVATVVRKPEFTEFYASHKDEVLRFAHLQAGPGTDAENIAAEAWKLAYVGWKRIMAPRPWIYRVVVNLVHSAAKERRRTCPSGDPDTDHGNQTQWTSTSAFPGVGWAEQITDINRGLQQLSSKQRAAVLLS